MTDDEFRTLLRALAARHLPGATGDAHYALHQNEELRHDLEQLQRTARMLKVLEDRPLDDHIRAIFRDDLMRSSPIERSTKSLATTGLLDALEDAQSVIFSQLRRGSIPDEDVRFLRQGGYTDDEIEILFALAIQYGRSLAQTDQRISDQLNSAAQALNRAVERLDRIDPAQRAPQEPQVPKRKPKILNGIGKVLGGSIAGVGNALMATGTILAPNPATAAGAIASAGLAVTAILTGIGDLRGE